MDPHLKALERLRTRRERALADVDRQVAAKVAAGLDAGVYFAAMARALGLSRQGLYDLIDRVDRPEHMTKEQFKRLRPR